MRKWCNKTFMQQQSFRQSQVSSDYNHVELTKTTIFGATKLKSWEMISYLIVKYFLFVNV